MKNPTQGATTYQKNLSGGPTVAKRGTPSSTLRVVRGTVTQKTNKPGGAKPLGKC